MAGCGLRRRARCVSLQGSIDGTTPVALLLERVAPNPAVVISASETFTIDQLFGLPAGSYHLRASASGGGSSWIVQLDELCTSPNPIDSDGDSLVDGCDVCPLVQDPAQLDTDEDGIGDACDAIEVPALGPAASGLLALALLLTPAACSRARRPDRP